MQRKEFRAIKELARRKEAPTTEAIEAEVRRQAGGGFMPRGGPVQKSRPRLLPDGSTGEFIDLGRHRLLCADSRRPEAVEFALDGRHPTAIVFDPPYEQPGIYSHLPRFRGGQALLLFWDTLRAGVAHEFARAYGWQFQFEMVWDCGGVAFRPDNEPDWAHKTCGLFGAFEWSTARATQFMPRKEKRGFHQDRTRLSSVFKHPKSRMAGHPHAKPDAWIAALLAGVDASSGVVLDPFLGGGSTLRACEAIGAVCCGIEIDPTTFEALDYEYTE